MNFAFRSSHIHRYIYISSFSLAFEGEREMDEGGGGKFSREAEAGS